MDRISRCPQAGVALCCWLLARSIGGYLPAKYPSQACSCMQLLALIFEIAVHSVHPKKEGTLHNVHTLRARNGVAKLAELRLAGLPLTAIAATRSTMSTRREPASRGPLARGPGLGQRAVSAAVGRPVSVGTAPGAAVARVRPCGPPPGCPSRQQGCQPAGGALWLAGVAHASLGRSGTPVSAAIGGPVNALRGLPPPPAGLPGMASLPPRGSATRSIGRCALPPPSPPRGLREGTGGALLRPCRTREPSPARRYKSVAAARAPAVKAALAPLGASRP